MKGRYAWLINNSCWHSYNYNIYIFFLIIMLWVFLLLKKKWNNKKSFLCDCFFFWLLMKTLLQILCISVHPIYCYVVRVNSIFSRILVKILLNEEKNIKCTHSLIRSLYFTPDINHICGVMVSMLASSVVDHRLDPWSNQRLSNWYLLLFLYAHSIKEKEQKLVDSESG